MHSLHLLVPQQDSDVLAIPCAGAEADVLSCNVQCAREWQLQAAQLVSGRHVHLCYFGTWLLYYAELRETTYFFKHNLAAALCWIGGNNMFSSAQPGCCSMLIKENNMFCSAQPGSHKERRHVHIVGLR